MTGRSRAKAADPRRDSAITVLVGLDLHAEANRRREQAETLGTSGALWLTRSQQRRRDLESSHLNQRGGGLRGLYATFPEWVFEYYESMRGRLPRMGRTEQLRLIERLLEEEARSQRASGTSASDAHPFREASRRPGLVDRFRQLVAHLKQSGCRDARESERLINGTILAGDGLARQLREPVARVFGRYQAELKRLGLVDEDEVFFVVEEPLRRALADAPRRKLLVLEGLYQLNAVQRRLLDILSAAAEQTIVLCEGYSPSELESKGSDVPRCEGSAAVHARDIAWWHGLGATFQTVESDNDSVAGRRGEGVENFRHRRRSSTIVDPPEDGARPWLTLSRSADQAEELRAIARDICDARANEPAGQNGMPRLPTAILLPSLEGVTQLAQEIFARHSISLLPVDRVRLSDSAPARVLSDLLGMIEGGFARTDVFRVVLSPLVDPETMVGTRPELRTLRRVLAAGGLLGGRGVEAWVSRIEKLRARAERRIVALDEQLLELGGAVSDALNAIESEEEDHDAVFTAPDSLRARFARSLTEQPSERGESDELFAEIDPELPRSASAREWLETFEELRALQETAPRLLEQLRRWAELRTKRAPLDHAESLIAAFQALRTSDQLIATARRAMTSRESTPLWESLLQRDLRAVGLLGAVAGEVGRVLALEEQPISWEVYVRHVREAIESEELDPPEHVADDRVLLLSRLDARQRRFSTLYLAGLTADAVPGRQRANIFFTEKERALVGWRTHEDTVNEWRHLLSMATVSAGRVALSWHGSAEDPPGSPVRELCAAFGHDWQSLLGTTSTLELQRERLVAPRTARDVAICSKVDDSVVSRNHTPQTVDPWRERRIGVRTNLSSTKQRLAATRDRDTLPALSAFDGTVAGQRADSAADRAAHIPEHITSAVARFTPTALESYASCPWEAFTTRIARLQPRPGDPGAGHASNEHGRILHEIMAGLPLDPALPDDAQPTSIRWDMAPTTVTPTALAQKSAWQDALTRQRASLEASLEDDWLVEDDSFWRGQWDRWMRAPASVDADNEPSPNQLPSRTIDRDSGLLPLTLGLQEGLFGDWLTVAVEAGVGVSRGTRMTLHERPLPVALPAATVLDAATGDAETVATESLLLRGVIDRLDFVAGDGSTHGVVIDYKSGKVPRRDLIEQGEKFQLPLYLLALREAARLASSSRRVALGGALYLGLSDSTVNVSGFLAPSIFATLADRAEKRKKRKQEPRVHLDVAPIGDFDAFLRLLLQNVARARAAAARGLFPTAWSPSSWCDSCDLRRICRRDVEAKRAWLRRHRDEFDDLGLYRPIVTGTT